MRRWALLHDYLTCLRIVGLVSGLLEETTLLDAHYLRLSEDSENTDPHRHVSDVLATSGVGDVHDVGVLNGVHPCVLSLKKKMP